MLAAYALKKKFTIVRTYIDEGRSGLRMKGRAGFIELIDDVQSRGFRPYSGLRRQPLGKVSGCR
jgi:DNA invertase Pin-like site-specific DNA recombinase